MINTNPFNIDAYLKRIGLNEKSQSGLNGLKNIVHSQLYAIPFENIDSLIGKTVSLDAQSLWQKIVIDKRGGYCFELNYLLSLAMEYLKLEHTPFLARVMMGAPVGGPKTHLLYAVLIDNAEYIVDVGFGGPGLIEPMLLKTNEICEQDEIQFKLIEPEKNKYILQRNTPDGWFNLYTFNREKVIPVDVELANYFTSTHPHSPFRNRIMCAFQTKQGLLTFRDNNLLTLNQNMKQIKSVSISNLSILENMLSENFSISLNDEIIQKVWTQITKNIS